MDAFVGIDVAFAKQKRLPVSVCVRKAGRIIPFPVAARCAPSPPRGAGNVASLDDATVSKFADETAAYLRQLESYFGVSIRRIAIDAPSDPKIDGSRRRKAEEALDVRGISCFTTPSLSEFEVIGQRVRDHLRRGGAEFRLPHANQLWMLIGFALFKRLRREWECLEVFPQATARILGASSTHKRHVDGCNAQLRAIARYTGWPESPNVQSLRGAVHGPAHDGLDAYLSAWVAALEPNERTCLGAPPDDVIWVPAKVLLSRPRMEQD
jgi:hypothetical protein